MRKKIRAFIINALWYVPFFSQWAEQRMPRHTRGYKHYWESPQGEAYRQSMVERQEGLDENPSAAQIHAALRRYEPKSILEVGCGFGRILKAVHPYFPFIEGADIAKDLLDRVPMGIRTYHLDIVKSKLPRTWDIVFCRALLMYFVDQPQELRAALSHMDAMAAKKVVIWEWPHVLEALRPYITDKFELHAMSVREE